MKARCDRRALLEKVGLAAGITASRGTRAILQHVLLDLQKDALELVATDLEIALRSRCAVILAEEPGTLALPAARLLGILRETHGETIDISSDGLVALIRSSGSQFRLAGENPADFPETPSAEGAEFAEIPAALFRELTERTELASSRELGRYAINGILVELEQKLIRFVATDGRRLALAEATVEEPLAATGREILPLKALNQFLKAVGPEVETVALSLSGRRTLLRAGETVLAASSVEAEFPDYQAVVGAPAETVVNLDRDEFFRCIRQAAVMASDDIRTVLLSFSEGSLVVLSSVEGLGDARSEMAVDFAGQDRQMSFNPDFLLEFSKVKLPDQLPFHFKDASAAAMFRPADDYLYVVMPINS